MHVKTHRLQRGFSLVEVFVALLVMSVGLIALAKLQVDLVRGSSDARARTIALNLAEEKIEDLRTFAVANGSGTWSTTVSPMAWSYVGGPARATPADTSCIPACAGGRIPSSTLEVAGVRFTRTWEVDNRNFTGPAVPLPTLPITSGTKDVRVTVSWQNEAGTTQSVNLVANLVDIPPGNVALASQPVAARPPGPKVLYTPGVAPEVIGIPIDTGTGKRETTKPLPYLKARGYSNEVSFDVVNYHNTGSGNVVDRREEFVTVNCRCALAGPGRGRTPARVAFTGAVLRDAPGKVITSKPQTGVLLEAGSPDGKSDQPVLCNICCRDHHDGPAETLPDLTTDYNRYKPTASSNHQHFLVPSTTAVSTTGAAYDEACRLKRVNGVFQVFQDWKLQTLTVAKAEYLRADPGLTNYVSYVQDYVEAAVEGSAAPGKPTGRDFVLGTGSSRLVLGRGIYIDHMPAALVDFVADRIADGDPFLEFVPFYEINLSKLATWSLNTTDGAAATNASPCPPAAVTSMVACVTNEPIVDEGLSESRYSRGNTVAGQATGARRVVETARTGNSGLTGTFAISAADSTAVSDYVTATVIPVGGVNGNVSFCPGLATEKGDLYSALRVSYSAGAGSVSCQTEPISGGTGYYHCDEIPPGSVISINPSFVAPYAATGTAAPSSYTSISIGTTTAGGYNFTICRS
ncbi:MAG: type IV pilus modification PilV family protein [Immundisolibacter sp.]|uniref:type IV pilus modification PilV family protein n=1 Tax=Immundisolibacter sp. TaxID=1934948 RepID=UPI003EE3BC11